MTNSPLFIPVILGTLRQGRQSEYVAKFIVEQIAFRDDVETQLIDIRNIPTYIRRLERFMNELVWMSTVLRYRRLEFPS